MTDESLLGAVGADADTADLALVAPLYVQVPARVTLLAGVRRQLAAWAAAAGLTGVDVESVVLAGYEALANAAEHAFGPDAAGTITLTAELADGELRVRVTDTGKWREPPADPGMRGRGLLLIRGLAHTSSVRPGTEGTTVEMAWRFPA